MTNVIAHNVYDLQGIIGTFYSLTSHTHIANRSLLLSIFLVTLFPLIYIFSNIFILRIPSLIYLIIYLSKRVLGIIVTYSPIRTYPDSSAVNFYTRLFALPYFDSNQYSVKFLLKIRSLNHKKSEPLKRFALPFKSCVSSY